jgi:hypothetical protein
MICAYETYLTSGGVSGRLTGARAAKLRRLHEAHHGTTCRRPCRVCGAEDCGSASCLGIIIFRMELERHGGPLKGHGPAR